MLIAAFTIPNIETFAVFGIYQSTQNRLLQSVHRLFA